MKDTYFDRCIRCNRIRMGLPGEDSISGWMCDGCVRMMDGHKGVLHGDLMRFLSGEV